MYIVENCPLYTCFFQETWQAWFPYPFRNPHPRDLRPKVALYTFCKPLNLRNFISIRNRGKNRFIVTAAYHLDLIALNQLCDALYELWVCFFQPI